MSRSAMPPCHASPGWIKAFRFGRRLSEARAGSHGKWWENDGRTMGELWDLNGKTIGKP